jgi:hypothetical protein
VARLVALVMSAAVERVFSKDKHIIEEPIRESGIQDTCKVRLMELQCISMIECGAQGFNLSERNSYGC